MSCSVDVSYQIEADENKSPARRSSATSLEPAEQKSPAKKATTSFVLVDPATYSNKNHAVDAKRSIRKHASKACAAQRLATIAQKKKSQNVLTKRERRQQQSAQKLEAALRRHAEKLANISEKPSKDPDRLSPPNRFTVPANNAPTFIEFDYSITQADVHPPDVSKTKCSIPWLLSTTPPHLPFDDEVAPGLERTPIARLDHLLYGSSPAPLSIHTYRIDPFSPITVAVQDTDRVYSLLDYIFHSTFPLLDIRLPTKYDKLNGTRFTWQSQLYGLILSSQPLFWTVVLAAGTLIALKDGQNPSDIASNMEYRSLAVASVNKRLSTSEDVLVHDAGLMGAIASLGTWERQCGNKEIWRTHCQGVETLQKRLNQCNYQCLLAQMIASCQPLPPKPHPDDISKGFARMQQTRHLDLGLVSAVCACSRLERTEPAEYRLQDLQETTAAILSYSTTTKISAEFKYPDGNRLGWEMHVLVQGAGYSMTNYLARDYPIPGTDHIDILEMCREATDLWRSVSSDAAFDELLLWAMFTLYTFNDFANLPAVDTIAIVARRLHIASWPALEKLVREFVYLDTAAPAYQWAWARLRPCLACKDEGV